MKRNVLLVCALATALLTAACDEKKKDTDKGKAPPASETLGAFTGTTTRVVWVRPTDEAAYADIYLKSDTLSLWAFDSETNREWQLLEAVGNYRKPLISTDGESVVFSAGREKSAVYATDWKGKAPERLCDGVALMLWRDPADGRCWAYVGREPRDANFGTVGKVVRFALDQPEKEELVWEKTPVAVDNFSLSRDGRYAAALFPWPDAGVFDLQKETVTKLKTGCWPSMSPDDSRVVAVFAGSHQKFEYFATGRGRRWKFAVNDTDELRAGEVYHGLETFISRVSISSVISASEYLV